MAGRNVTARFAVEADVAQAKRDLEAVTQQIDQLGKARVDGARQELEQLNATTSKLASGYTALSEDQRKAYQQREQDAQQVDKLRRTYKTLEGALETLDVQVKNGWRSMEEAARLQPQLAAAYTKTGQAARQVGADFQAGAAATKMAATAQDAAHESSGRLRFAMGNLANQIQDVAVQTQMGTNAFVIMAQQGPQIAGAFGPAGAAIGAVIAVASVAAGAIFGLSRSADDAETSFTNYAKAMEFAKKASEELKTATGASKAALEAEGRAALDAAEKRLVKAQADLKGLEASMMQPNYAGDAAGQGGIAAAYLLQASRVKTLNMELETLRGSMGVYNDGARAVTAGAGQASTATKSLAEQTDKLRESLRGQIKDLGVQIDTFDKDNAVKLRAKLQTEAMTAAGVSDYKAVDAGTRKLIDQAVARQEQIDKLEDQKKAQEEATRAAEKDAAEAERLAEQHKKTIENADKYLERLKGEADALVLTERERFIANKAMEFELQNRGKLSGSEMDTYLAKVKEEAGALYDSTEARKKKSKAEEESVRALEKYQQDVTRVATDIGKDISENLWDQITGEAKAGDALQFFKNWAKRLAVEMLNQTIVLPITMQIVGSMPSLFGIQAPAGAAANQNGAGLLGGNGNLLSMGSKLIPTDGLMSAVDSWGYSALGIGSQSSLLAGQTVLAPSAEVLASQTAMLQAANPGLAVTAAPTVTAGSSGGAAGGVAAGTGLSAYLGAAGAGAFGGMLGGMLGTATNSKAVGGLSGAALGAGGAALGAEILGISAMGGPVGLAIGAIVGGVMGLLGTQKATVGKTASADVTINASGKSATYGNVQVDNEGDPATGKALGTALSGIFSIAALGGGKLTQDFGIGQTAAKGLYVGGSVPYKEFGMGDNAIGDALRYMLLERGGLQGGGVNTIAALKATKAKDWEEATKDIALGASIDAGTTALAALDKSLNSFTKSAKDATAEAMKPMFEEMERAKKLGIDRAYKELATGQLKATLDQIRNPVDYTQREQEMASLTGQFAAIREAVAQLNPEMATYVDQIEAETRARIKSETAQEAAEKLNEAMGRGYLNQIKELEETRGINARNLAATGLDVSTAGDIFNASLTRLLNGLDDASLSVVAQTFTGDIARLATAIRNTSDAAVSFTTDLVGRVQSALGNDRGASLIALDAQQAAALATARASGYDTTTLQQVQATERAAQAFKLAQADVLAAYDKQITAQQDYVASLTDGAVKLAQSAREFRSAYDALALNDNSPLNAKDRLEEARRQFGTALTTYRDAGATTEARDAAKQSLLALGPSLVQMARGFFGSTSTTDYDYVRSIFSELGDATALGVDTAEQQLATANATLKELQRQRADAAALGAKQYGSLTELNTTMTQSLGIWQAQLVALQASAGGSSSTAPTYVDSRYSRLQAFTNDQIEQNFGSFSDIIAARAANPDFNLAEWFKRAGINEVLAGTRKIPGFATGTLSTPPGAVWVGENGPELLWQGGAAAVASSVDSLRIAKAFEAANDRWSGNVTLIRSAASSSITTRGIEQRLDRAVAVLERVVEAIDAGNEEAVPALKALVRQGARSPVPLGRRMQFAR